MNKYNLENAIMMAAVQITGGYFCRVWSEHTLRQMTKPYVLMETSRLSVDHADEITFALKDAAGTDLSRKYLRLGEIKRLLGDTKKI